MEVVVMQPAKHAANFCVKNENIPLSFAVKLN